MNVAAASLHQVDLGFLRLSLHRGKGDVKRASRSPSCPMSHLPVSQASELALWSVCLHVEGRPSSHVVPYALLNSENTAAQFPVNLY